MMRGDRISFLAGKARVAFSLLSPGKLRARFSRCPDCGPTLVMKLADNAISVRCARCGASAIHMSIMQVLQQLYPDLSRLSVYEMSSRGPLFMYLRDRAGWLVYSEFFDDVVPGTFRREVQCQDVQALTYDDASFDLCTSTEVFEHVPDDRKGFREIRRVLRSGGRFVFTVPLSETSFTIERAVLDGKQIRYLLEPEYHGDAIRGQGRVLCFRNYGLDIIDRLKECGFRDAYLVKPNRKEWWGFGVQVVVAET
jgi:SAM-dependent methyltransferase